MSYPILEFDASDTTALIEPGHILPRQIDMPEACVMCFFQDVIGRICGNGQSEAYWKLGSEIGVNDVFIFTVPDHRGVERRLAVVHPGVGAPLAGAFLEEVIALGAKYIIACGGCGVLNPELALGHLILPDAAIRDEGTSYHYLPPSREVEADAAAFDALMATLEAHDLPYVMGKTWTTDAIYRETPARIARRKAEGCISVEMEAAAFFAIARFRGVQFAQLLYAGDDLSGEVWDHRSWHRDESTRERVFWLAAEAALRLSNEAGDSHE